MDPPDDRPRMTQTTNNPTSPARRRSMATPAWVRRMRYSFSREKLREFATTLGLVVPLTVLIWIWAEREQTLERDVQVTVDVRSRNPGTVVSLVRGDEKPGPASVTVNVSGPKVGVDSLLDAISRDTGRGRISLEVNDDVGADGTRDVPIQPLLDQQNLFRDYGVTVRSTEPDTLKVRSDPVVTEELRPSLPDAIATRVESIMTQPPTIRVRGSAAAIERLRKAGRLRAELDVAADRPELRDREPGQSVSLENLPIRPLDAAGVTLEPSTVTLATLKLSQTLEGELQAVVVNVSQPSGLKARVGLSPEVLPAVKIVGPPDVLRQLTLAEGNARPYASVRITRDDVIARTGTRRPTIENLPPGVKAVEASIPEVSFDVSATTEEPR